MEHKIENISVELYEGYIDKFKSRLFGLLCEYEKGREWERFLDSILIEMLGFAESEKTIYFYTLYYKLSSLKFLAYKYFRATIFECMSLCEKLKK